MWKKIGEAWVRARREDLSGTCSRRKIWSSVGRVSNEVMGAGEWAWSREG